MSPEQIAIARDLIVRARHLGAKHDTHGQRGNRGHSWNRLDICVFLRNGTLHYYLGDDPITAEDVDTVEQAAAVLGRWNHDYGVMDASKVGLRIRRLAYDAITEFGSPDREQARVLIDGWHNRKWLSDSDVEIVLGWFPEAVTK